MQLVRHTIFLLVLLLLPLRGIGQELADTVKADTTLLSPANAAETGSALSVVRLATPVGFAPYYDFAGGPYGWALHEGFNAQVGLSVSAAFGKHAPHGVGFGQHVAFAYAQPFAKRWYWAAGLIAANTMWNHARMTELSIGALLGYRINERLDAYAYATKSIVKSSAQHFDTFWWNRPANWRVGAGVEYKFSPAFSMGLGMEISQHDAFNPYFTPHTNGLRPYSGLDW